MNKGDPTVESQDSSKARDFRVADGLRSDKLPSLVALARSVKALSPFVSDFVTFHLVLDANKAQHELRWRLGSRKKVFASTRLYEAIVSGVFVAYSPTYIETEISAHEKEIAFDTDTTVEDVRKEWALLLRHLHLYEPGNEPLKVKRIVDEKDLPYASVRSELGVRAIYTDDPDLMLMEQPVVMDSTIDLHLRDYARSSTVKIGISLGSGMAFAVSLEMIPVLYGILKGAISWIRRQSPAVQLAIVGAAVALAIHPKSRAGFSKAWAAGAPVVGDTLRTAASQLLTEYVEANKKSDRSLQQIEALLPPEGKRTVLKRARAVCTVAKRPLSVHEIARKMREDGYQSQSPHLPTYLRRVLRGAEEFSEVNAGKWALITPSRPQ